MLTIGGERVQMGIVAMVTSPFWFCINYGPSSTGISDQVLPSAWVPFLPRRLITTGTSGHGAACHKYGELAEK